MNRLHWREIGQAPPSSGVYAWYYNVELAQFDIERLISSLSETDDPERASCLVKDFFERHVFGHFIEQPYTAVMRGPLKPTYEGTLAHRISLSGKLVDRIVEEPQRLYTVKSVLERSAPMFSSPLYIGMSSNLRTRLLRHKALIEKYSEYKVYNPDLAVSDDSKDAADHSFAKEVVERQFVLTRLFVVTDVIEAESKNYVDIENILNRIHFPLLGRN